MFTSQILQIWLASGFIFFWEPKEAAGPAEHLNIPAEEEDQQNIYNLWGTELHSLLTVDLFLHSKGKRERERENREMESAEGFESTAQIAHNVLNHACSMHTHMDIKTFFSSTTSYWELKKKNRGPETTISAVCTGITHMSTHLIFKAHILFWLHLCSNPTTSPVWWSFSCTRQGRLNIIRTAEWWNLMPVNYPGCCCLDFSCSFHVVLASADHWWRRGF